MNGTEISKQLELAITASLKAGKAIMEVYDSTFEVEYKDDNSPLTLADKKSNDIINTFLKPTEIPIISEENKQIEFEVRRHWKFCWIVDP
ncbi:MAG TPA: inositol monophosphatase family protein, partial [Mangrovimonas sp.]|nr:inositol monophosphatase family protein [Mangrovimonas sp.]